MEEFWANQIIQLLDTIGNLGVGAAEMNGASYNAAVASGVNAIIGVVKPAASMLLGLLCMLEFYNLIVKLNTHGMQGNQMTVQLLTMTILKISIAAFFIRQVDTIMWGIYEFTESISDSVNAVGFGGGAMGMPNKDQILGAIADKKYTWIECIMAVAGNLSIYVLIVPLCWIVIRIMFIGRMFEIYLYVALSPLPLITLVHEEYSQIGKNFIKSFAAVCLQGAAMNIVLKLYTVIVAGVSITNDIDQLGSQALMYGILLVISLIGTSRLCKSLCNAM